MAIKFATSSLSGSESNVYKIDKFNGVDYTTTPTNVDDTRAIDMSNYLPEGDSLVKRNGFHMVNDYNEMIFNVWEYPVSYNKKCFVFLSCRKQDDFYWAFKFSWRILNDVGQFQTIKEVYFYPTTPLKYEDVYSYGVNFECKLFILAFDRYLMISGDIEIDGDGNITNNFEIDDVKNHAYVPTTAIGIGPRVTRKGYDNFGVWEYDDEIVYPKYTASFLEQTNLLVNKVKLELIKVDFELDMQKYHHISFYDLGTYLPKNITITELIIGGKEYTLENKKEQYIVGEFSGYFQLWNRGKNIPPVHRYPLEMENDNHYMLTHCVEYSSSDSLSPSVTIEISYVYDDGTNPAEFIEKMRFGMQYGSKGYKDRLFLAGNSKYKNIEVRSCDASMADNNWQDYTYFGDSEYHALGSSDTAIIGYGMLNNGSMITVKESGNNSQPNLFFKTYNLSQDANGNYIESFPVTNSGLAVNVNKKSKIINYGNDLLISTNFGLYKILAGDSTATQTYFANEMSYFIRNNLNNSLEYSDIIVYQNKLFWNKQDVNGVHRVYVADSNKYGVVNGNQTYEWWALDGLNVKRMFVINGEFYYANDIGLFKMSDDFNDVYKENVSDVTVNGTEISGSVFIDTMSQTILLPKNFHILDEILTADNVGEAYKNFRDYTKFEFFSNFVLDFEIDKSFIKLDEDYFRFEGVYDLETGKKVLDCLLNSKLNGKIMILYKGVCYFVTGNIDTYYEESDDKVTIMCELNNRVAPFEEYSWVDSQDVAYFVVDTFVKFDVKELYTEGNVPFSECEFNNGEVLWVSNQVNKTFIGYERKVLFNKIKLQYKTFGIKFDVNAKISQVTIHTNNPVSSYWRSKYNSLGREDYLKTIDRVTFVAESRRGGTTNVGYRSYKNMASYTAELSRGGIDFDYFEFNKDFSKDQFAMTHTSKRKVKNLAYMQIVMDSKESTNSSISSISMRYRYTRNNKGVK